MPEPFDAIGFQIKDDASYKALAEQAHQLGAISKAHRPQGTLHGCCWRLGAGLEVWTVLYESAKGTFYADCRPAFRGQRMLGFYPWEILEYEEDGEAILRGAVRINSRKIKPVFEPMPDRPGYRKTTDTDYIIRGQILSWREIYNPRTEEPLLWIDVDAGKIKLEVIINRADLKGELKPGAWMSAEAWLQGHIVTDKELMARYEGIDRDVPLGDWWIKLRRDH